MKLGSFTYACFPIESGVMQRLSGSGEYGLGSSFASANAAPKRRITAEPAPIGPFTEPQWIVIQAGEAGASLS